MFGRLRLYQSTHKFLNLFILEPVNGKLLSTKGESGSRIVSDEISSCFESLSPDNEITSVILVDMQHISGLLYSSLHIRKPLFSLQHLDCEGSIQIFLFKNSSHCALLLIWVIKDILKMSCDVNNESAVKNTGCLLKRPGFNF